MIHQTAPQTCVGTFPIPLWRSESVRLSLRLYDYVLALQPLFTFVRYGFTRSNNIPSWSSQRASAGQTRYEASPVIISSLRREQRGELGNGASNVLDVVGLHHQP